MELNQWNKKPGKRKKVIIRILICLAILLVGLSGWVLLASMKKPPAEAKKEERALKVEIQNAVPENVPVFITGYGEVKTLNVVSIASEISGKIVEIHPRLETGEIIPRGETLFRIDPSNYSAALKEAKASVSQWDSTISRLKSQQAVDTGRLKTIERNRDLAKAEYKRIRSLFENDSIGTRSGVERAEQSLNNSIDIADQMNQTVILYPIRIREAESSKSAALARLDIARANLKRSRVLSPFNGRVKSVSLEKGQYVAPGQNIITLADDSILEIHVPLDSRDSRKWLLFNGDQTNNKIAWFSALEKVTCKIQWTEDKSGHYWSGQLHRIVKFDQQTRTLTVAVRIDPKTFKEKSSLSLPLVEGMFCSVIIPGKNLENVYRLPRHAVTFKNTVYTVVGNRLKTISVKTARVEGDFAYISDGLKPGDKVITTRLVDPLENILIEITHSNKKEN